MLKINPVLISGDNNNLAIKQLENVPLQKSDNGFQESLLQALIHEAPYILPIKEYYPSVTGVASLGREIPIQLGGGRVGYIDNLLVTNDGHLILVETKLARNPEAIREVVAQTLDYGMTLNQMSLISLEKALKSAESKFRALDDSDTVRSAVIKAGLAVTPDFEYALEKYQRTGEILYLIVADGIHVGVDRLTGWLNENGSSAPYQFGLVELNFYHLADGQRFVVPKPLLKTTEISRHVIVVDIRNPQISAEVIDHYQSKFGNKVQESRTVKPISTPMTKEQLLQQVSSNDLTIVTKLIKLFEDYGFDESGTSNYLRFGLNFPEESEFFHTIVELGKSGVWATTYKQVKNAIGLDEVILFRNKVNEFAPFYREDQINKPDSSGCEMKYRQLESNMSDFVTYIETFKNKVLLEFQNES